MKKRVSLTRALTFGMAVLSLPTLALAQAVSVKLGDTGELTGAGVVVPVTVACMDDTRGADLEVRLTQIFPSAIGEGDLDLTNPERGPTKCGSTPQTVHVLVRPDSGSPSFGLGKAAADAALDACDASGRNCNELFDLRVINIVD
jgi:hypothetical protein